MLYYKAMPMLSSIKTHNNFSLMWWKHVKNLVNYHILYIIRPMNVKIDATEKKFQTIFAFKNITVRHSGSILFHLILYHKYMLRFWLEKLNWRFLHSISQNNFPIITTSENSQVWICFSLKNVDFSKLRKIVIFFIFLPTMRGYAFIINWLSLLLFNFGLYFYILCMYGVKNILFSA